jgi:hypothetical protein
MLDFNCDGQENSKRPGSTRELQLHLPITYPAHSEAGSSLNLLCPPPAPQIPFKLELVRFATDNDSIGAVICRRADQLNAAAVVMAKHNKGRIKEFFVGSATVYCTHHCKSPLLIMHCD